MAWNATASQAQFAKYHRRFRSVTMNGVATAEKGNAIRIRWVPGTKRKGRAVSSHCKTSTAWVRPKRNRFMICSTTGGTENSRKWSRTYFLTCCPRSVERINIGLAVSRLRHGANERCGTNLREPGGVGQTVVDEFSAGDLGDRDGGQATI